MEKKLHIEAFELYDQRTGEFISDVESQTITIKHSLLSLSKWEAKWKVNFIGNNSLTKEMIVDYIKCMTMTKNVDDRLYMFITDKNMQDVMEYIKDPMSATKIKETPGSGGSNQLITSELIYAWMAMSQIPFECEKWHLNRLLTLIRAYGVESNPKKKMKTGDVLRSNHAVNAARRAKHHSRG